MTEAGKGVLLNNKRLAILFFLVISIICIVYSAENKWQDKNWKSIITSDGSGYYAYLPCMFINHNFDFKKLEGLNKGLMESCYPKNGKFYDKYFIGVSVLLTPFFLLAYFLSYLFGYPLDGYSLPFQFGAAAGGLFYLMVGLIFTRKLLMEYRINGRVIYFTLFVVLFASNLFYYSTIEPTMSHTYSFAMVAIFLYYTKRFSTDFHTKDFFKLAVSLCLLVLVRPIDIFCIAIIPFIAGTAAKTWQFIRSAFTPFRIAIIIVLSALFISLQVCVWHAETGNFLIRSYSSEGFYFLRPHFWQMFLSFRKGWFVYTPVMLIATVGGLYTLFRRDLYLFCTFLFFFITFFYVSSCWWCWFYGDSYGMRIFIDYYALFALLLALFLNSIPTTRLNVISAVLLSFFLIMVNWAQQYQYMNLILSRDSMSKGRYYKVFLKTDDRYKRIFYSDTLNDIEYLDKFSYSNDFEHDDWGAANNITALYAHSGKHSAFIDSIHIFGPGIVLKASDLPLGEDLYVNYDLWIYSENLNDSACVVINSVEANGTPDGWVPFGFKATKTPPLWEHVAGTIQVPFIKTPTDLIKVFLFYSGGKSAVYVDDFKIRFGVPK